ncbi:MAG: HAD-IG family 5'-nucleotidase, partial [Polyangiaceae bacterium]|nr:HAD-IG family 5'-nucleotidase [Polyangiaceae bacterium]
RKDTQHLAQLAEHRSNLEEELRANRILLKKQTRRLESQYPGANNGSNNGCSDDSNAEWIPELPTQRTRTKRTVDNFRGQLLSVDSEVHQVAARVDTVFHPYWGSLLKEGAELSSYGDEVQNCTCLYTSRVSNFLSYSPTQHFRSPRDVMPHEV